MSHHDWNRHELVQVAATADTRPTRLHANSLAAHVPAVPSTQSTMTVTIPCVTGTTYHRAAEWPKANPRLRKVESLPHLVVFGLGLRAAYTLLTPDLRAADVNPGLSHYWSHAL